MKKLAFFGLCLIFILTIQAAGASDAFATRWFPQVGKLSYQVKRADAIVAGRVKRVSREYPGTVVLFKVDRWLKWRDRSDLKRYVTIITERGAGTTVAGAAGFKRGERAVVMLSQPAARSGINAFMAGRYEVLFMENGKHPIKRLQAVRELTKRPLRKPKPEILYVLDRGAKASKILAVSPRNGRIAAVVRTGRDPQFAVAPDGQRLYVVDTYIGGPNNGRDRLRIIETADMKTVRAVRFDDRVRTHEGPLNFPTAALSQNGRRLHILKTGRKSRPPYRFWISSISTRSARGVGRADLGDILSPVIWADKEKLVLGLGADSRGRQANLHRVVDLKHRKVASTLELPGLVRVGVAGGYDGSNSTLARGAATLGGVNHYYVKDKDQGGDARIDIVSGYRLTSREATASPAAVKPVVVKTVKLKLAGGRRVSGLIALPDDGTRLFVGAGPVSRVAQGLSAEVLVLDNLNPNGRRPGLKQLSTIRAPEEFTTFAPSRDGTQLYLLNAYTKKLSIYDVTDPRRPKFRRAFKIRDARMPAYVLPAAGAPFPCGRARR